MKRHLPSILLAFWFLLTAAVLATVAFAPTGLAGSAVSSGIHGKRLARLAGNTLYVSGLAAAVSALWALLPALAWARWERGWQRTMLFLAVFTPLLVAPQTFAVGAVRLFGAQGFATNLFWEAMAFPASEMLEGTTARTAPVYSLTGTALTLAWSLWPLAFLAMGAALRRIDRAAEDAAILDTTRAKVFLRVTLPMAGPGVLAGAVLVLLMAAADLGVPESLRSQPVLVAEVYVQFGVYYDSAKAVLAALLLAAVALVSGALLMMLARSDAALGDDGAGQEDYRPAPPVGRAAAWVFATAPGVLLFAVIWATMTGDQGRPALIRFTLDLVQQDLWLSIRLASIGAVGTVLTGFVLGSALARMRRPMMARLLVLVPFIVPAPVIGIGLRLATSLAPGTLPLRLDDALAAWGNGYGPLLTAWTLRFAPLVALIVEALLRRVAPEEREAVLLETRRLLPHWRAWVWPAVRPAFVPASVGAFALCFGELGCAVVLLPPGPTTLSVRLQTLMHYAPTGQVSAICLMMLLPGLALLAGGACWLLLRRVFAPRS